MQYNVSFPGLGLEFAINRVAISIGGFNIYWYGILIALGMVLAMVFAFHFATDFGIDSDRLIDVVFVGAIMAVVCARICYVAMAPFDYNSIWEMFDIRLGGIAIYGAVIGAFVFGGLTAKLRKIPILPMFDLVAMGFLIGQGVGRWGNFVNQEAFGGNTSLPWGMYSEGTHDYLAGMQSTLAAEGMTVDPTMPVHPTFLYESIWCLLGFLVLFAFMRRRRFHGQLFLMYVIWYGMGRYVIEGLRTDSLMIGNTNLRFSQMVALVSVAAALVIMVAALQRVKGRTLMVPLAVSDIKKQAKAGELFDVDQIPAATPHAEFVRATAEMNLRLSGLDLDAALNEEGDKPDEAAPVETPAEGAAPAGDGKPETAEPAAEQPAPPPVQNQPGEPEKPAQGGHTEQ